MELSAGGPPPVLPLPADASGVETGLESSPAAVDACLSLAGVASLQVTVTLAPSPVDETAGHVAGVAVPPALANAEMVSHCVAAALASQVFEAPAAPLDVAVRLGSD